MDERQLFRDIQSVSVGARVLGADSVVRARMVAEYIRDNKTPDVIIALAKRAPDYLIREVLKDKRTHTYINTAFLAAIKAGKEDNALLLLRAGAIAYNQGLAIIVEQKEVEMPRLTKILESKGAVYTPRVVPPKTRKVKTMMRLPSRAELRALEAEVRLHLDQIKDVSLEEDKLANRITYDLLIKALKIGSVGISGVLIKRLEEDEQLLSEDALHWAVFSGNLRLVNLVLASMHKEANLTFPMKIAIVNGFDDIVERLLFFVEITPDLINLSGRSPNNQIPFLLLDAFKGDNVDSVIEDTIIWAMDADNFGLAEKLLERYPILDSRMWSSFLRRAMAHGNLNIAKYAMSKGGSIDTLALYRSDVEHVRVFLYVYNIMAKLYSYRLRFTVEPEGTYNLDVLNYILNQQKLDAKNEEELWMSFKGLDKDALNLMYNKKMLNWKGGEFVSTLSKEEMEEMMKEKAELAEKE